MVQTSQEIENEFGDIKSQITSKYPIYFVQTEGLVPASISAVTVMIATQ